MQLPKLITTKKKPKQYVDQNPIEAITSILSGVKSSVEEDLGKAAVTDAWDQLLGLEDPHLKQSDQADSGDLTAGKEINLSEVKKGVQGLTEMGHEFAREIVNAGKNAANENSREIQVKIQEILIEIKQLANSTKDIQAQVEVISVEQTTDNAGTYHANFLENMLSWLRDARMNVEDSLAWFTALRSKKASKQYGTMAKKHGTSFTLSNERTASTQTG